MIVLNLVMRIGIRQRVTEEIDPRARISDQVFSRMTRQGEAWAARVAVINRMAMVLTQACETVVDQAATQGQPITVTVSFDEFSLDAEVSYTGLPLPLPEKRPSDEEILEDPSAMLLLGGFLIHARADWVTSVSPGGLAVLRIHMEH